MPKVRKMPANREETKRKQLVEALEKSGGNQSKAARILGVSRVIVWNRMKRFNINLKSFLATLYICISVFGVIV
jgi:transcriptional regulator of acetoin/glycerol metabolism